MGGTHGHHCMEHGTCVNTPGGYTCACAAGYRLDSTNTTCLPVDMCHEDRDTCDDDATCISTGPGLYTCQCHARFSGDGFNCQREQKILV